jgi:hypothetical protein
VALGRLGGLKGGPARAEVLSAIRRREIASRGGVARFSALSAAQRGGLARRAARARWAAKPAPVTASDAPIEVRRLLKSYDPSALRWSKPNVRYLIVTEILVRGDGAAKRWLRGVLRREQVRHLVRRFRGAGCNEPQRAKLRRELRLSVRDVPRRPYLGLGKAARPAG